MGRTPAESDPHKVPYLPLIGRRYRGAERPFRMVWMHEAMRLLFASGIGQSQSPAAKGQGLGREDSTRILEACPPGSPMHTALAPRRFAPAAPSATATPLDRLRRLLDINIALNTYGDTNRLLRVITQTAAAVANCEAASILLYDEHADALRFEAASGQVGDDLVGMLVPIHGSLAGTIYTEDRVVYASNAKTDGRHYTEIDGDTGFDTRSLLGAPMRIDGRPVGVLEVLNPHRGGFTRDDAEALLVVAAQAAVAIRNARYEDALLRLNQKLADLDRLKNNFLAITSHEMRTPLTSVRGFGQILAEEVRADLTPYADAVVRAGYRMTNVVETLDVMASLHADLGMHPGRVVSLRCLMVEAAQSVQGDIRVRFPEGVEVEGHGPRIRLAFTNLLRNAVQFSSPASPVSVDALVGDGGVHIRIRDEGRGLQAEDLERIFEAYEQVSQGDQREHEGLGVGLTVARAIAVQHGGRLWAESPGLGAGSTFHLTLPLLGGHRSA